MDLTIDVENFKLNIRVAVLIRTDDGILFEKSKDDYYFLLGGRVKINESSLEAAKREVFEEISVTVDDFNLISVVENFFETEGSPFHEICFVYVGSSFEKLELPENIVAFKEEELDGKDIRPDVIKKIITSTQKEVSHFIIKS